MNKQKRHFLLNLNSKAFKLLRYLGDNGAFSGWTTIARPTTFNKNDLRNALKSLNKNKLVVYQMDKISFSEKGKIEYIKTKIEETEKLNKDDICLVVFDIPETQRKTRTFLNRLLIELAFIKIQKSVWISQFNNAELLKKLLIMLKIKKWVRIFTGKEE